MRVEFKALLVDIDGTICQHGHAVPGALDALAALERRGIAYRFVTNMTSRPRAGLVRWLADMEIRVEAERIFTAPLAARDRLLERGTTRAMLLVAPEVIEDFDGIEAVEERPDAVVVGDMGSALSFEALDRAFRAVLDGAELVALGRNRYFLNEKGVLTVDVGPIVAALEYATQTTATLVGKPDPAFFRSALDALGVRAQEAAMVGDDIEGDVGGAQAAGLLGILVKTGKFRPATLQESSVRPDFVLESLSELPERLR